ENAEAIVCAPFIYLSNLVGRKKGSNVKIAAQTMHYEESGAFTGEVSPSTLASIVVSHVVIDHSKSREYYKETDETVNHNTIAAFKHGLTPIVFVGETLEQREANESLTHIETHVTEALKGSSNEQIEKTII